MAINFSLRHGQAMRRLDHYQRVFMDELRFHYDHLRLHFHALRSSEGG